MFPPQKILFPVDFSDRCTEAARMVETFTGHFQAQLTLLNIVEPFTRNDVPVDGTAVAKQQLATYLAQELEQLDVSRVVLEGDPAAIITEYADARRFDLIMMPTHGYGAFRRIMIGSITGSVLRNAACPVWTGVHMEQMPPLETIAFRKVVCAIDFDDHSCAALTWATRFASEFDAEFEMVHCVPDLREHLVLEEDLIAGAEARMKALQESVGAQGRITILTEEVPSGVCGCAGRAGADLLVIGRSAPDGILGRLRANAYSIVRQSPCPVVSV